MLSSQAPASYRSDIDGLRAVAVLSVIVFHIFPRVVPGGFVGVDVFFVISGFLITRSITNDLVHRRFSLVHFYERRVKRIFPAMAVVVLVTTIAAQLLMLPGDALLEAKSGLWSVFSAANIYFWLFLDTGYFAADSSLSPLLHLWSLGVEEQFYLIYPLGLWAAYSRCRRRTLLLGLVILIFCSFFGAQLMLREHSSFAYYSLPTRAGELLLGALTALAVSSLSQRHHVLEAAGWLGSALLVASLALLSEASDFPGRNAAIPTLGTALIIWGGQAGFTSISRFLSLAPLRWVGLISYSAYLWHWPLLAFYRYGYGQVALKAGILILVLSIVLGWLSYILVEQPARRSGASTKAIFFRQLAIPSITISALCLFGMATAGYGYRAYTGGFKSQYLSMMDDDRPPFKYSHVCQKHVLSKGDLMNSDCEVGPKSAQPARAILWGDSNAAHYVGALAAFAERGNFRFFNLEHSACPPIFGDPEAFVTGKRLNWCRKSLKLMRQRVQDFEVIILSASWSSYSGDSFLVQVGLTISELTRMGKKVIVLGKAPIFPEYDRLCGKKALLYPWLRCERNAGPLDAGISTSNDYLREIAAKNNGVEYYDLQEALCPSGMCSPYDSEEYPLYFDKTHLGLRGSRRIGEAIVKQSGLPSPFKILEADQEVGTAEPRIRSTTWSESKTN